MTTCSNIDAQRVISILSELLNNINIASHLLPETLQIVEEQQLL